MSVKTQTMDDSKNFPFTIEPKKIKKRQHTKAKRYKQYE